MLSPEVGSPPASPSGAGVRSPADRRSAPSGGVVCEGISKSFASTRALVGLDLEIPEGSILAMLGPNGAGKTTAVRILTTLIKPDSGHATVAGIDVVRRPHAVRAAIGLTGQFAAVDDYLTGAENLLMFGRLYGLPTRQARARARDLLARFELTEAAGRIAKTYSGGMRRRLDIAASLIAAPPVLFLDEPTTGLDPRSRIGMWDVIAGLVRDGTTILLTTQYLEEADRLANSVAVIDHGQVIARGTADQLKEQVGGFRVEVVLSSAADLPAAAAIVGPLGDGELIRDDAARRLAAPVPAGPAGSRVLAELVRQFDAAGLVVDDLALRRPTLDDVFLQLTGHAALAEPEPAPARRSRRGARKKVDQ